MKSVKIRIPGTPENSKRVKNVNCRKMITYYIIIIKTRVKRYFKTRVFENILLLTARQQTEYEEKPFEIFIKSWHRL